MRIMHLLSNTLLLVVNVLMLAGDADSACLRARLVGFKNQYNVMQNIPTSKRLNCCDTWLPWFGVLSWPACTEDDFPHKNLGYCGHDEIQYCLSTNYCDHTFDVNLYIGSKLGNNPGWSGEADGSNENRFGEKVGTKENNFYICNDLILKGACDEGWTEIPDGKCAKINENELTFAQARVACEAMAPGAHLVEPRNSAQNQAIKSMIGDKTRAWIGGFDHRRHEGRFLWSSDYSPVTWADWFPGQPNNGGRSPWQDCMSYYENQWDDDYCNWRRKSVCEKTLDGEMVMPDVNLKISVNDVDDLNENDFVTDFEATIHPMRYYGTSESYLHLCANFKKFEHSTNPYQGSTCRWDEDAPFTMGLTVQFVPNATESALYDFSSYRSTRIGRKCTTNQRIYGCQ